MRPFYLVVFTRLQCQDDGPKFLVAKVLIENLILMGQASSTKRKHPRNHKLKKKVGEDASENQVLEIYSNTDKNAEENELSLADSNNTQKDKLPAGVNVTQCDSFKGHTYRYDLVRAASTSAKIRARDPPKQSYRLSIQTFLNESLQPVKNTELNVHTHPEKQTNVENIFTVHTLTPRTCPEFKKISSFRPKKREYNSATPIQSKDLLKDRISSVSTVRDQNQCNCYSSIHGCNKSRLMIQALKRATGMLDEKSIMCDIHYDLQKERSEPDIPSTSSVVLLPSPSQPDLAKVQWEAIVPKLLTMPTNKVLYVVEIKNSKQRQCCNGNADQYIINGKIPQKHVFQTIEEKYEIGSTKILKYLEAKYRVQLKTLNQLLQMEPKQFILFLTKGVLTRPAVRRSAIKLPLDYNSFMDFFLSGV
ncbi:hypothetical protein PPYR_04598 [Photinus pyralis]|uniref:Uncharacterized protein n=1 Tax=Photinus pyralis TaxID=7054 RepID=A0A5N4AYH2_PHOPY|nr:hypothetical protein PPYR_04598 [Photinus pyralis]